MEKNKELPFVFESSDTRLITTQSGERVVVSVSSHAMALASPVWKKFLFPPFPILLEDDDCKKESSNRQEAQTSSEQNPEETSTKREKSGEDIKRDTLDFTPDNYDALIILLCIAHLRFDLVPQSLVYDRLFQVAILCDQYDCFKIVRPWLEKWMAGEDKESKLQGRECWLFVAWVFRREKVFSELAAQMVRTVTTEVHCAYLTSSGLAMPEPMPPEITERIFLVRNTTIKGLLDIPYNAVDRVSKTGTFQCQHSFEPCRQACDVLTYGSIVRRLEQVGLWPRKTPDRVHWNVQALASWLSALEILQYPDCKHPYASRTNHLDCSARNFKEEVSKQLSCIPDPVLDSHRQHLKNQH